MTLVGSGALSGVLLGGYFLYNSQLAFAQFADSVLDVVTAGVLAWTVNLSTKPEDANHHFGHKGAQPVGALVTAVLTGVLAAEVVQKAITALLEQSPAEFDSLILWTFVAKIAFKLTILFVASGLSGLSQPAMRALAMDARNDILTSTLAVVGFMAGRYGAAQVDAWLALPLGGLIAWSGFQLAAENVRLLMGEAPPDSRQREIVELARAVPGVVHVGELRAHHVGTDVHFHLEIQVNPRLSVGEAHDIGEAVRLRIEQEPDVSRCSIHIDPARA